METIVLNPAKVEETPVQLTVSFNEEMNNFPAILREAVGRKKAPVGLAERILAATVKAAA